MQELKATTQRDCSAVARASSLTACVQLFGMRRGEFEGCTYWVAFWKGLCFPLTAAKPMLDETAEKSNCRWTAELEVGFTVTYPPSYTFYWRSVQQVLLKLCFLTNPLCLREWQCAELITDHLLTASEAKILCSSLLSQEAANGHSRGSVLFLVGKRNWKSIFRGCRQPRTWGKWTLVLFGLKLGA